MSNPNPNQKTRFKQAGREPLSRKAIGVRLPVSIDTALRELAGDELSEWIRQAIAEKLEREQKSA